MRASAFGFNSEFLTSVARVAADQTPSEDAAHDYQHVRRVFSNAMRIAADEGADLEIVGGAALLHELFNYPKNHPDSARSGEVCADKARGVLQAMNVDGGRADAIAYAIAVHPFSLGVTPTTLEARVLQDADRLDSLGAIGIARCFATGAKMGAAFYCRRDPFCLRREPDDKAFSVDHFFKKLLRLPETMHTDSARRIGEERVAFMHNYLAQLGGEVGIPEAERSSRAG